MRACPPEPVPSATKAWCEQDGAENTKAGRSPADLNQVWVTPREREAVLDSRGTIFSNKK